MISSRRIAAITMLVGLLGAITAGAQNWIQWSSAVGGNDHFYAMTPFATNWGAAQNLAIAWGGTLATITSSDEQDFITSTFLTGAFDHLPVWIGLTDELVEGTFVWVTGEPLVYSYWKFFEPNDYSPGEDYVAVNWEYSDDPPRGYKGTWNDTPHDGTRGFGGNTDGPYFGIVEVGVTLPNLTAFQPSGWSDKIVVSRGTGTSSDSSLLTTSDRLYVDWALINAGDVPTTVRFAGDFYLDGVLQTFWYFGPPVDVNEWWYVADFPIGPLGVGTHTLRIVIDSTGAIGESDEGDNEYTKTISVTAVEQPDFVVSSLSFSPSTPQCGQPFTAYVTVRNQGTASGDGRYLDVWLHQTSAPSCVADGNAWQSVGSLAVGQSKVLTFANLTAPASGAPWMFRAFVDSYCHTPESNENNNQTTANYGGCGQPDFVVSSVTFSPSQPVGGQPFTATVTVGNQGSDGGDGRWLDVWVNQSSSPACGTDGNTWQSVSTLAAGASKTLTFANLTAPASGAPWTFRAFVDSYCQTPESNDSNNQMTRSYGSNPSQPPDFIVTSIALSPAQPGAGQVFSANVTVRNQGSGEGDGRWLDVWLNQPSIPSCGTDGNAWQAVGALAAGASKTLGFTLTAPASGAPWTFRAFADSYCQATESNDANNQATVSYGSTPLPPPDFIVSSIAFSPAQPIAGQPFTAYVTVRNQGSGLGDGRWLDVWIHQPGAQACGTSGDDWQQVGTLAAGASKTLTFANLTTPANGAPWTFRAFVDSTCRTTEANDGNNQLTASYGTVPAERPDFVVTAASISPGDPTPGTKFTAYITVKNQGAGSGDGGWLDVWANNSVAAACGDTGDRSAVVGMLTAGQTKVTTIANLTAGPAGASTLLAFVDSGCATAESNDANNQRTLTYSTTTPPTVQFDLEVSIDPDGTFPDAAYLTSLRAGMQRAANLLHQMTDGQMTIRSVTVYRDAANWHTVDMQIRNIPYHPDNHSDWALAWPPIMRVMGFGTYNGGVSIPTSSGGWQASDWDEPDAYRTFLHELGHYHLRLNDEYGHYSIPGINRIFVADSNNECTDSSYACLMDFQYGSMNICVEANHDADHDTAQHQVHGHSCWWTIHNEFPLVSVPSSTPTALAPSNDPAASATPASAMAWTVLPALP